jgi:hypothetical protein
MRIVTWVHDFITTLDLCDNYKRECEEVGLFWTVGRGTGWRLGLCRSSALNTVDVGDLIW